MLLAAASYGDSIEVSIERGQQLGKLLRCLGHRKLWGPRGVVAETARLNAGRKLRKQGNLIYPRTTLLLPLPDGIDTASAQSVANQCSKGKSRRVAKNSRKRRAKAERTEFAEGIAPTAPRKTRRAPTNQEEDFLADDASRMTEKTTGEPAPEMSALTVSSEPPSVAAVNPTPLPEPSSRDNKSAVGKPFRAGISGALHQFSVQNATASEEYTQGGLGVLLGGDVAVGSQVFLFAEAELLALSLGSGEAVRPVRIAAGGRIRLGESSFGASYLLPSLQFRSLLGLSVRSGYQNLQGPALQFELRRPFGQRAGLVRLGAAVYSSDTAFLTPANRSLDFCAGLAAERSWSDARWTILACGALRNFEFQTGSGKETAFSLGTELRF